MSSQAILKISSISNSEADIAAKEQEILRLLQRSSNNQETLVDLLNALVKQQTLPVKQILVKYIEYVQNVLSEKDKIKIYEEMINIFSPPTAIVYLPLMKTILNLTTIYESESQYYKALDTLKILQVDTLVQDFEDLLKFQKFKVEINTRIAKNSLKINDYESAEAYISRITPILAEIDNKGMDSSIVETYKVSVETIVKLGKWFDAASKLLMLDNEDFDTQTVKYTILAQHDPLKTRLLKNIMESPHILHNIMDTPLFAIFQKIYEQKIIYYDDYTQILSYYLDSDPYQLSSEYITTALSKAILENNLISASKVYANSTIKNFSEILQLDESFVIEIAAHMIRDGRLDALVDDISKVIEFNSLKKNPLKEWHNHMTDSCTILRNIVDQISYKEPVLAESYLNDVR